MHYVVFFCWCGVEIISESVMASNSRAKGPNVQLLYAVIFQDEAQFVCKRYRSSEPFRIIASINISVDK